MMTIKDGKFYKDGVHVPIEHGNKEQIAVMTSILNELKLLETEGIEIDPHFEEMVVASYNFKCSCGSWVRFSEVEGDDETDATEKFIGQKKSCKCNKKYLIDRSEDGFIVIKYNNKS